MKCPKCGTENNVGVKFCGNCGSSMGVYCPNCGAANSAGAKFCINCGQSFGIPAVQSSMPVQPVVVLKGGLPGWVWAIIGVLLGVIVIGGLVFRGILPLGTNIATQPPLQPVLNSPEVSTEAVYCPETGGVILYWNAGYDCSNDLGDPGYRLRYGDGFQDLNTGQFDNQASSIRIPSGWSVRLYENVEGNGASHCFNTSTSNFEDLGNFDNRDLLINDNVTSMQVFRDGTCGQDLAAGAEPAPMPEDVDLGLDAPAGTVCTDQVGCACLPDELKALQDEEGFLDTDLFAEKYVDEIFMGDDTLKWVFHDFDEIFEKLEASGLTLLLDGIEISSSSGNVNIGLEKEPVCIHDPAHDNNLVCEIKPNKGYIFEPQSDSRLVVRNITQAEDIFCTAVRYTDAAIQEFGIGGGSGGGAPKDCRDYGCPSERPICTEYKQFGTWGCEERKVNQPPAEDHSSGCTPGCWCVINGEAGCWQDCASHCSDP